MASPQTENGFTRIANELLEQMAKIKLSPTQYRILFVVWRNTYGFNRKSHTFSLGFFATATECDKRSIQRDLNTLAEKQIILQEVKNGIGRKIEFNKDYEAWGKPTIGSSTNGKTTNGKTTIGETTNSTIGSSTNATIGSSTNQERKKERKKKEDEEITDPIIELLIKNNIVSPGGINFTLQQDLEDIETNFNFDEPEAMIREAVKDAARGNGRTWKFVYNKLNLWRKQDIKNVLDLEQQANIGGKQKQGEVDFTKFAK